MLPSRSVILAEAVCTTIWPKFRVPTDLFLLFAHDHLTKKYRPLSFILSFVYDNSTKIRFFIDLFLLFCAQPFDQTLGSSLIYLFYLYTTIRPKIRVPISLIFFFVHDHSTKN